LQACQHTLSAAALPLINAIATHLQARWLWDAVQRLNWKPEGVQILQRLQQQARLVQEHLAMQSQKLTR
jgi:hypothetical protein